MAKIFAVDEVPGADKLCQLTVDLGNEQRKCAAGIKEHFGVENLVGRMVVVLANLELVEIRGVRSECVILGAKRRALSLLKPNPPAEPGNSVS